MYDIMNEKSYESAKEWVKIAKGKMRDNIAILLVGNKNDCSDDKRAV